MDDTENTVPLKGQSLTPFQSKLLRALWWAVGSWEMNEYALQCDGELRNEWKSSCVKSSGRQRQVTAEASKTGVKWWRSVCVRRRLSLDVTKLAGLYDCVSGEFLNLMVRASDGSHFKDKYFNRGTDFTHEVHFTHPEEYFSVCSNSCIMSTLALDISKV